MLRWTILCIIPFVNLYCLMFWIGSTSLKLERKLDETNRRLEAFVHRRTLIRVALIAILGAADNSAFAAYIEGAIFPEINFR